MCILQLNGKWLSEVACPLLAEIACKEVYSAALNRSGDHCFGSQEVFMEDADFSANICQLLAKNHTKNRSRYRSPSK